MNTRARKTSPDLRATLALIALGGLWVCRV